MLMITFVHVKSAFCIVKNRMIFQQPAHFLEQCAVPILVYDIVALRPDHPLDCLGVAVIVDVELLQFAVGVGIAARVGVQTCAHRGDP